MSNDSSGATTSAVDTFSPLAMARFAPADVARLPTAPAIHGVNWVFKDGDTAAYETGCQQVVLD